MADIQPDSDIALGLTPTTTDVLANDGFNGVYGTDYVISSTTTPTNGTVVINPDGTITYTADMEFVGVDTYEYTVTVTNADGSTSTETTTVTVNSGVNELAIDVEVDNQEPVVGNTVTFTYTLQNLGDITQTNVDVLSLLPSGYRFVSSNPTQGTYSNTTGLWTVTDLSPGNVELLEIVAEVLRTGDYQVDGTIVDNLGVQIIDEVVSNNTDNTILDPLCLTIYNEFSPNGDGQNDRFVIDCIENFPNNSLEIYNRWGNIVYKTNNYQNDWEGESNGRVVIATADQLPEGTYYYILDLGDGSTPIANWLYINR